MDKSPLVSVLLISYNQEKYIKEALEGALNQDYSPLEIIISDDCSKDGTFQIIEEMVSVYRGNHKIVINRNSSNIGLGPNFTKAMSLASGEWVVAMAGDDISYPHRISCLVKAVSKYPDAYGIGSFWNRIDGKGNWLCDTAIPIAKDAPLVINDYDTVRGPVVVKGCADMWRRALFAKFGPLPDDVRNEDDLFTLRALLCGKFIIVPDRLLSWRTSYQPYTLHDHRHCSYAEFKKDKEHISYCARWNVGLYRQALRDIEVVRNQISDAYYKRLKRYLTEQLKIKSAIAQWWQMSVLDRVKVIYSSAYQRRMKIESLFGMRFYYVVVHMQNLILNR